MMMRVNNDVTVWLTTGHWSRQAWPQCDIIIDPYYHRTPYFRQVKRHQQREASNILCMYRQCPKLKVHPASGAHMFTA